MVEMVLVYTTVSNEKDARSLAEKLLSAKVCACVNMHPISSMYWWEGAVSSDCEYALLCKTAKSLGRALVDAIKENHPYEVPCILEVGAKAEARYGEWVSGTLSEK